MRRKTAIVAHVTSPWRRAAGDGLRSQTGRGRRGGLLFGALASALAVAAVACLPRRVRSQTAAPPPLSISQINEIGPAPSSMPAPYEPQVNCTCNEPCVFQLQASGGTPPYRFSLRSGTLPQGLALNTKTGLVSGKIPCSALP